MLFAREKKLCNRQLVLDLGCNDARFMLIKTLEAIVGEDISG
jgi:hypothetical protein